MAIIFPKKHQMKKSQQEYFKKHLEELFLRRVGNPLKAGLLITSLPLPRYVDYKLSFKNKISTAIPIGQWYDVKKESPRRVLLIGDGENQIAPDTIKLTSNPQKIKNTAYNAPSARMSHIEKSSAPLFMWERHALQIEWHGNSIEIAMGIQAKGKIHWWEACRLVLLSEHENCRIIEMGGAIPVIHNDIETLTKYPSYRHPFLHKHNWINGHIYARLHSNGVCEIFAHHINSKFFDDGLPFEDVVPVIGFRTKTKKYPAIKCNNGILPSLLNLTNGIAVDFSEISLLSSSKNPAKIFVQNDFLITQPFKGAELFGGLCPEEVNNDPWIIHANQKKWLRGLARTFRFTVSLNPNRSPKVIRYLAPPWLYGMCEEFMPEPLLPVSNDFDCALTVSEQWLKKYVVKNGFEVGAMPRHIGKKEWKGRHEPGWEGEVPYAHFLLAWRKTDSQLFYDALRDAYFLADVCVDHATKTIRMHGYPPNAVALPMARIHGIFTAFLECGDPYLRDTAQAVIEASYRLHKNSWPRLAVGRDACFIRGAVFLYRYTGEDFYRKLARNAIDDVINSQRENGSFGDQGGGTGIHQWGGYISKPWMGLMAVGGLLDYLELFPSEHSIWACIKKFADWLMKERFYADGIMGWGYQHDYNGLRMHYNARTGKSYPLPGNTHWHKDYFARLMLMCSLKFKNPSYYFAWLESFYGTVAKIKNKPQHCSDHFVAQAVQYIPWLQSKLWNATIDTNGKINIKPFLPCKNGSGTTKICTPNGWLKILNKNNKFLLENKTFPLTALQPNSRKQYA